jgi:tRNA A37 methylthiotransferase MiaB
MRSKPMPGSPWRIGLVQINNSFAGACYLPYAISLLQAHFQLHSGNADAFSFLLPIYRRIPVDDALRHLAGADIVAISVSSWNFRVSLEIARRHKEIHPQALIMLGGPHIPGNAESLLRAHPWVDLVCHGEGEIPFLRILDAWPKRQWGDIPSISYLEEGRYVSRPEESRIAELDSVPSPYLAGTFEPLLREDRGHQWLALWETNRGCPFSCSYCDWGAATRSKLYCFGLERLREEIDWFAEHRIEFIFCCDANFGILPRDLDIVKAVADAKKTSGFPQALSVQNTKNSDRSYEIQKALAEAGLSKGVNLAMQSMHPETLALIGRRNIPPDVFQDLQQRYNRDRIETFTDIIIGLPGETYASFTSGVEKIIGNGQHNRIQFINLSILPNAPMAEPAYRQMHGLVAVVSRIINIHGAPADYGDGMYETQKLVVGSNAMPKEDWRRARVFAWMTSLLYFDKLLQIPMMLMKAETGIDCVKQIEAFMDLPAGKFPLLEELARFFRDEAAAIQEGAPEFFHAPDRLGIYWPHDEYAYIRLSAEGKLDAFYREARQRMAELAVSEGRPCPPWLPDAVRLNGVLLKQPFHKDDITFRSQYDLLAVCDTIRRTGGGRLTPGPASYVVNRSSESWQGWEEWSREVVWYGNKRGAYLYNFSRGEQ